MQEGTRLSIKKTAALFGMTIDTLYYYEKIGLVVPRRNPENGYRSYGQEEFARLNVIKTLTKMEVSLSRIKDYFDNRTLFSTICMLRAELLKLDREAEKIRDLQKGVESILVTYATSLQETVSEEILELDLGERPYIKVGDGHLDYRDFPRLLAEKAKETGVDLDSLHLLDTYKVKPEHGELVGTEFLLFSEVPLGIEDGAFPAGKYLSLTFRGSFEAGPVAYRRVKEYMEAHDYQQAGDYIVFWIVDESVTAIEGESIQKIQVAVEQKG